MAIHLKSKSFQWNLFFSTVAVFLLMAVFFGVYQYQRERAYKTDILHSRLQMYNYEIAQALGDSLLSPGVFKGFVEERGMEGVRVTVIDTTGRVLLDSERADVAGMSNHLDRAEVIGALRHGSGYDIKRVSLSTERTYFYSATRVDGVIIRSAVPYSAQLTASLRPDNTYLIYTLVVTCLLGMVLYRGTSRIGRHVSYLRQFAERAAEGRLPDEEPQTVPDDELGDISRTITTLYRDLRRSEDDKVRMKRQLTQNAAHELKTPAFSIRGYLETILQHPEMKEEQRRHFLEQCYAQSERMSKLLLDMAALTRLDNLEERQARGEEPDAAREEVDVAKVLDDVLRDSAPRLREKGIEVNLRLPEKVVVAGDANTVYSLFRNLVDNTVAYATGATLLRVVCAEVEDDGAPGYEFAVSDNGAGVEPRHLPHLFERFYRVDKGRSRELGGTGLGLAIVKNAVATMGGAVVAETTPGGGLTVRFTLNRG